MFKQIRSKSIKRQRREECGNNGNQWYINEAENPWLAAIKTSLTTLQHSHLNGNESEEEDDSAHEPIEQTVFVLLFFISRKSDSFVFRRVQITLHPWEKRVDHQ